MATQQTDAGSAVELAPRNPTQIAQSHPAEFGRLWFAEPDPVVRVRCIHPDRANKQQHPPYEFEGRLSEVCGGARKLNEAGYNVYAVAQPYGPVGADRQANDSDIIGARGYYADGDDVALPASWHVLPTFLLVHPETARWWAFWRVNGAELDTLPEMQRRIAKHYGADPTISNPSRIVRLPGFYRWKLNEQTKQIEHFRPYELRVVSGVASEAFQHQGLPAIPQAAPGNAKDGGDVISLDRLRGLLLFIHPERREDWLSVGFVIRDAVILGTDGKPLEPEDRLTLFDQWSSGELWEAA